MRTKPAGTRHPEDVPHAERLRVDQRSLFLKVHGRLLNTLKSPGRLVEPGGGLERRTGPRYEQVESLAWLGWKSWRRFHMKHALVLDIGRGGARIFLDVAPPPNRRVWIYLQTPTLNAVVKARVLEIQTTQQGQCVVRLKFIQPCPEGCFATAVLCVSVTGLLAKDTAFQADDTTTPR